MSGRKIGKIAPISATSPSAPVDIGQTNSILSDPDGRWVAKRQSAINAALEQRHIDRSRSGFDGACARKAEVSTSMQDNPSRKFSGESERIGKGDWGDRTPFGKHVGYL